MKLSIEWLSELMDLSSLSTKELADLLEERGVEVEAIADPKARFTGEIVVAEVKECEAHPDADKLRVCKVFDGSTEHQVVCGAPNVAAGQRIPFAKEGTVFHFVDGELAIKARKLRGVESRGMICSLEELGLADKSEGIWVLPEDAPTGKGVVEALSLQPVFELAITPNRPDLFSHRGLARELCAALGQTFEDPAAKYEASFGPGGPAITIDDVEGCARYTGLVMRGLKVGPSPAWLAQRLEAMGQRPINNVVDATNYVMFELGQPMHAFDLTKLGGEGAKISVVTATKGQKFKTLDDAERELRGDELLIASNGEAVAMAGVMGGADSQVDEATTDILLESATFDPVRVRTASRAHGLHSESSHRFERGVDTLLAPNALQRCAKLLEEIAGGKADSQGTDTDARPHESKVVRLAFERAPSLLGVSPSPEDVETWLSALGFAQEKRSDAWLVTIPSWRPDVEGDADLVEEIARSMGYEAIPATLPALAGEFHYEAPSFDASARARDSMLGLGFHECITYGFGAPARYTRWSEGELARIENPLGEEMSALRTSLLPGLLSVLDTNAKAGQSNHRYFELGRRFTRRSEKAEDPRDAHRPIEELSCAFVLAGNREQVSWTTKQEAIDFFDAKGVAEELVESLGIEPSFVSASAGEVPQAFHPYGCAKVYADATLLGWVGALHPRLLKEEDIDQEVFAMELSLEAVASVGRGDATRVVAPSRFPASKRDLALVVARDARVGEVIDFIRDNAGSGVPQGALEAVRLFDVYAGEGMAEDKKSLAFSLTYRSDERTLRDEEVAGAMEHLIKRCEQSLGAKVR